MIDEQELKDILGRWQSWVQRGNMYNRLGIKISGYAERIPSGSYGDGGDHVEADVLEINELISRLPRRIIAVIGLHYCDNRPIKSKTRFTSTLPYYANLELARGCLLDLVNETRNQNTLSKERLHESG